MLTRENSSQPISGILLVLLALIGVYLIIPSPSNSASLKLEFIPAVQSDVPKLLDTNNTKSMCFWLIKQSAVADSISGIVLKISTGTKDFYLKLNANGQEKLIFFEDNISVVTITTNRSADLSVLWKSPFSEGYQNVSSVSELAVFVR